MPPRSRPWAASALVAITVAGCGASHHRRDGARLRSQRVSTGEPPAALPAGWRRLRLASGAALPYPASWRVLKGDPGSASAALLNPAGTTRAYLNATPADARETVAGWARFRVRHNAAEGDRHVRLIHAQNGIRLAAGRASCVIDDYTTSRSRYRELACILVPTDAGRATVLVAAARPGDWARERPLLEFAINHFTG